VPSSPADEVLAGLRRATVVLLLDRLGIRQWVPDGRQAPPTPTERRVLEAAAALKILSRDGPRYIWTAPYGDLDDQAWTQLLTVIDHQISYLRLASSQIDREGPGPEPREQLAADPDDYLRFLAGVDVSHRFHARWFADRPSLAHGRTLLDLGGGLGTFAYAWVQSHPDRVATVLDLPGVAEHLGRASLHPRLSARPLDLADFHRLPETADVYLLANVLHLLPGWREVLRKVAATLRPGQRLAVFEADPCGPSGRLFDLQVHLRSGCRSGLLDPTDVAAALDEAGLRDCSTETVQDADDPFHRDYRLWITRR
jgi:SAM-dependent methyltransferase